jgi:HEAT repeat protein
MKKRTLIYILVGVMACLVVIALCWPQLLAIVYWNDKAFWLDTLENGKSHGIRLVAIKKLAEFYPNDKATILNAVSEALVHDSHEGVRFEAAFFLRCLGEEAETSILSLGRALQDGNPDVRVEAAVALNQFGGKAKLVISYLQDARNDSDPRVRVAVRDALSQIGP